MEACQFSRRFSRREIRRGSNSRSCSRRNVRERAGPNPRGNRLAVRVAKRSEPEPIRQTSGLGDPPEANVMNGFTIFAGTANPALAASIASELGVRLGACKIERFPDGEVAVRVLEPVRRKEVFLVQW